MQNNLDAPPQLLLNALEPKERILWWGKPKQGLILRRADPLLIPASILWAGFAFFWEYKVINSTAPIFMALFGIPFVAAGLYILVGRFFYDAWRRSPLLYALTTERILIVNPSETNSLDLATIGEMKVKMAGDGTGSIVFGPDQSSLWYWQWGIWTGAPAAPTFERIKDPSRVFGEIRAAQKEARQISQMH